MPINLHWAVDVTVGSFVWLSTAHLCLSAKLSQKLATRWAGPFRVVSVGGGCFILVRVAGWLAPPSCFSCQLTETSYWFFWDSVPDSGFCPPVDNAGEFEVEWVLDHRRVHRGCVWVDEYLVKWVGYGLFEATWEPSTHLANASHCPGRFLGHSGRAMRGDTHLLRGGLMLGFVCLVLFVCCCMQHCHCSLCVCVCFAYTVHMLHMSAMCVG